MPLTFARDGRRCQEGIILIPIWDRRLRIWHGDYELVGEGRGLAAVILQVPDVNKAIEAVKAAGGSLMRPPSKFGNLDVAFVKDPDGQLPDIRR